MHTIRLLIFAIVLAAIGAAWSQSPIGGAAPQTKAPPGDDKAGPPQPKPAGGGDEKPGPGKDSLEQLLTEALRNSPEIQLAEAKMREAEAELRKTRMQILQRVIEQQTTVE